MADDGFTPAQLAAITAGDGPLAIIAGPGTGKTTVLAGRLAHLVRERGANPASILIVTFTTDAARALRQQVARQLDALAGDLAISTLHAFGRKVITIWAGQLGVADRSAVLPQDRRVPCWPPSPPIRAGTWTPSLWRTWPRRSIAAG